MWGLLKVKCRYGYRKSIVYNLQGMPNEWHSMLVAQDTIMHPTLMSTSEENIVKYISMLLKVIFFLVGSLFSNARFVRKNLKSISNKNVIRKFQSILPNIFNSWKNVTFVTHSTTNYFISAISDKPNISVIDNFVIDKSISIRQRQNTDFWKLRYDWSRPWIKMSTSLLSSKTINAIFREKKLFVIYK